MIENRTFSEYGTWTECETNLKACSKFGVVDFQMSGSHWRCVGLILIVQSFYCSPSRFQCSFFVLSDAAVRCMPNGIRQVVCACVCVLVCSHVVHEKNSTSLLSTFWIQILCAVVFIQCCYVDRYELAEWITNNHAVCYLGILRISNKSKQKCAEKNW